MVLEFATRSISALLEIATGARLTILIYHRVLAQADPMSPSIPNAERFDAAMRLIRAQFNVVCLADAVRSMRSGRLPPRSVAITFDDGYADNATVALPILKQLGLCASFFVACGYLDGGVMWNDRIIESIRRFKGERLDLSHVGLGVHQTRTNAERILAMESLLGRTKYMDMNAREVASNAIQQAACADVPNDLMMTTDQVRQLADAGMSCGAHTLRHPILARIDDASAKAEIVGSKLRLEQIIGRRVTLFAYPNGTPNRDYLRAHVDMVRDAGFEGAVTTAIGAVSAQSDLFQLPRFTPWRQDAVKFSAQMVRNMSRAACETV